MKSLKFDHDLAQRILKGEKTSTWRLYDDKDISVNDEVSLVDKVDPANAKTWTSIGKARIDTIIQKRLGDIQPEDYTGHEKFLSREKMLEAYRKYYGQGVDLDTAVKIIHFTLMSGGSRTVLPPMNQAKLYADGGSRGNPGPSASGFAILGDGDKVVVKKGVYLGVTTNNQAEYQALKLGIEEALRMGIRELQVYMDSLLVINQMKGIFKIRNRDLWPIHAAINELCKEFTHVTFQHVPREFNKIADSAVNEALDAELKS